MKLLVDTHTHTVASGHAYSTLRENAILAQQKGLEGFVVADHGPLLQGADPGFILHVLLSVPDFAEGVRVIKGSEVDIMDYDGTLDVEFGYLKKLDFAIASLHGICVAPGTKQQNTEMFLSALGNPYIDVLGHAGNPEFEIDQEAVVLEAKRQNKLMEINNHSFGFRKGSAINCKKIAQLCKENDVRITVSSDAHNCYLIGKFDQAIAMLKEIEFPTELIVSRDMETFSGYLAERKNRVMK